MGWEKLSNKNKIIYTRQGEEVEVENYDCEESFCLICQNSIQKKRGLKLCFDCFLKSKIDGGVLLNGR